MKFKLSEKTYDLTLSVPSATVVAIITIVIAALTYWQSMNYELTVAVIVGIILVVLGAIIKAETPPVPVPTPPAPTPPAPTSKKK